MEKTLRKITAFLLVLAEMVCFLPQLTMNVAADEAEKQEGYTVTLTGGANAVASGGSTVQSGLLNEGMESVYYTADTGYYFEDFEDITSNGITVAKLGENVVQVYGIPEADVEIIVPDAVRITAYTVTLTGGANAVVSGGSTVQSGLTGQMESVYYTADTGYYFEDFEIITSNGITLAKFSDFVVQVYGMPEADVEIIVPDAVRIPVTTTYTVTLTGGANAVVSGGSTVQSGLTGQMEAVYYNADIGYYFEDFEDITSNGITVTKVGDGAVQVFGVPEADVELVVPDAVRIPVTTTYTVTLTGGANAVTSGGDTVQSGLTAQMESVLYTADTGYYFEDFENITINGITVEKLGDGVVEVYGTPESDVEIAVPDAVKIPAYTVTLTGGANAVVSGGSTVQIGLAGQMESVYYTADTGYYFEDFEDITSNGITVTKVGEGAVLVFGSPEADVEIAVPDAVKIPVTYTVRFIVVNGKWNDGSEEDILIEIDGYITDQIILTADMFPSVGGNPDFAYMAGKWNVDTDEDIVLTQNAVFEYNYAPHGPGWIYFDGSWYYLDSEGVKVEETWFLYRGEWYYMGYEGVMQTEWITVGGKRYYLTKSGAMVTGWLEIDSYWFYFDPKTGETATGWKKIGGTWYYFNDAGVMTSGEFLYEGDKRYYLKGNGAMALGWLKISGVWYYFDPVTGEMAHNGWFRINGKWYHMDIEGCMDRSIFIWGDKIYYLNDDGSMATGWNKIDGSWYYFDPSSGAAKTGWFKDGEKWYYFDVVGVMTSGEFQYEGDKTYYLKDNGAMATRWAEIDGNWYWFGSDGVMAVSTTVTVNGKAYKFGDDGICLNP